MKNENILKRFYFLNSKSNMFKMAPIKKSLIKLTTGDKTYNKMK